MYEIDVSWQPSTADTWLHMHRDTSSAGSAPVPCPARQHEVHKTFLRDALHVRHLRSTVGAPGFNFCASCEGE